MSSPPDFLGMALGMIQQRRQREAQAQAQAREQERFELYRRRDEEARRDRAFGNALQLIQAGRDPKAVMDLYGNDLGPGEMSFLKAEGKQIREQSQMEANTPKGAEMEDVSEGLAGIQRQGSDPLRATIDMIRAVKQLPYPEPIKDRLLQRGGFLAQSKAAREAAETRRVQEQSDITESRQKRLLGLMAAAKGGTAGGTGATPKIPPVVEASWQTFLASGERFEDWLQSPVPAAVKTNAMKHPEYIARMQRRNAPAPTAFQGVPFAMPPGQAAHQDKRAADPYRARLMGMTVEQLRAERKRAAGDKKKLQALDDEMDSREGGFDPLAEGAPAKRDPVEALMEKGGWVDIGGGVRVRKK